MKYKCYEVPDKIIDSLMEKLDISIVDACEMYLSDKGLIEDETVEELTKKAEKNRITQTIHQARDKKKTKKAPKKKENLLKKEIIDAIQYFLSDNNNLNFTIDELIVRNDEKYIDFTSNGREFTLNLVEHRPKKKSE